MFFCSKSKKLSMAALSLAYAFTRPIDPARR